MIRPIKILVISDEVWNDRIHGNNVLTNWFDGFGEKYLSEIANIYCSPGLPYNRCCKKYFQVTDLMMVKSIVSKKKAGEIIYYNEYPPFDNPAHKNGEPENKPLYDRLKLFSGEPIRAVRDIIWSIGQYDKNELYRFLNDFKPDIIYSPRLATVKILRLEKIIYDYLKKPLIAFTGDNEYSLRLFSFSPIFWLRRFVVRSRIREMMPNYSLYYTLSEEQKDEYEKEFGHKFKILHKCDEFRTKMEIKEPGKPLKMMYAGKLYCNRWKVLQTIGEAIALINRDHVKVLLDIFTRDKVSRKQFKALNNDKDIFLKEPLLPIEVKQGFKKYDIALHVESLDFKNRLITRVSFSTKIVDCLASGCAVMAICWNKHSGYTYLKREDAAICVDNPDNISLVLKEILDNPRIITEYIIKARNCGQRNHQKDDVQEGLYKDFIKLIGN